MVKIQTPLNICAQCLSNEISGWLTDRAGQLSIEAIKDIYLELRNIKFDSGECIVCNNNRVAPDCVIKIARLLEKHNASDQLKSEFRCLFSYSECPLNSIEILSN